MLKIHYKNTTEPCSCMSMAKPCLTRKCIVCRVFFFVCTFSVSGYVSAIWPLNQVSQEVSANKKTFYWPNWVETFQKWKVRDWSKSIGGGGPEHRGGGS